VKNYQKAIADFTEAIRLDPNYAEAYEERGSAINIVAGPNGNLRQAMADFNTAIRLNPNLAGAYYGRSFVRANLLGDYQGALDDATVAAGLFRDQGNSTNYRKATSYINYLRNRGENAQRGGRYVTCSDTSGYYQVYVRAGDALPDSTCR